MLSDLDLHRELIKRLPENQWAAVYARLRTNPALWAAAHDAETLDAFLIQSSRLNDWRPGKLGLLSLVRQYPDAASDPLAWIADPGVPLVRAAQKKLGHGQSALSLLENTALALDLQMQARLSSDDAPWPAVLGRLLSPDAPWRCVLSCLYGLLADPQDLIRYLLVDGHIETVLVVWYDNESHDGLATLIPDTLSAASAGPQCRLALALALRRRGQTVLAQTAVRGIQVGKAQPVRAGSVLSSAALATRLDAALLQIINNDERTPDALADLIDDLQSLTSSLSMELGDLAARRDDLVSARSAYEQAEALRANPALPLRKARIFLQLDQAQQALQELASIDNPNVEALLVQAQSHLALGNRDDAIRTASTAMTHAEIDAPLLSAFTAVLDAATHTADVDKGNAAGKLVNGQASTLVAQHAGDDPSLVYRVQAERHMQQGDVDGALNAGLRAMLTNPANLMNRRVVASCLQRTGAIDEALAHWRTLAEDALATPSDWLGLAECALALGDIETGSHAAQNALSYSADQHTMAHANIVLGKALQRLGNPTRAYEHLQRATSVSPDLLAGWHAKADFHRSQGDTAQALAALESGRHAISSHTPASEAAALWVDLGEVRAASGKRSAALKAFEAAVAIQPEASATQLRLAEMYLAADRADDAVDACKLALNTDRDDAQAWYLLARAHEQAGHVEEATMAYRQAVSYASDASGIQRDFGHFAFRHNRLDLARPALEAACQSDDAAVDTLVLLGALYEDDNDFRSALMVYKRAIQAEPNRPDLLTRIGVCSLALGQPHMTIAALSPLADQSSDNLELLRTLAQAYMAARLWKNAVPMFEQALTLAPDDIQLRLELAGCLRQSGKAARAIEVLQHTTTMNGDSAQAWRRLGEIYAEQKQWPAAQDAFDHALALLPDDPDLLLARAEVSLHLSNLSEATTALQKLAGRVPDNPRVFELLGETHLQAERPAQAQSAFERATALLPDSPTLLWHLGTAHWAQHQPDDAAQAWLAALKQRPNLAASQYLQLASALRASDKPLKAYEVLAQAAQQYPTNSEIRRAAADAARAAGQLTAAQQHLSQLAQSPAVQADDVYTLGRVFTELGHDDDRALTAFEHAARLAPGNALFQIAAADAHLRHGDRQSALNRVELALQVIDEYPACLPDALNVLIRLGDHERSLSLATRAVARQPNDPHAHFALARVEILQAELDQIDLASGLLANEQPADVQVERILGTLDAAVARGITPADANHWRGRTLACFGRAAEAIGLLSGIDSHDSGLYRARACAYRTLDQQSQARDEITRALHLDPTLPANLFELARVTQALHGPAKALAAWSELVKAMPDNAAAYKLLADALNASGDRTSAIDTLKQALALLPGEAEWHYQLAELHIEEGEVLAALPEYQQAVQLAEAQQYTEARRACYHAALAKHLQGQDNPRTARYHYHMALKFAPEYGDWWLNYGRLCRDLNDFDTAHNALSHAAQLLDSPDVRIEAAELAIALGADDFAERHLEKAMHTPGHEPKALVMLAELYASKHNIDDALLAYERAASKASDALAPRLAQIRLLIENDRAREALSRLAELGRQHPDEAAIYALTGEAFAELDNLPDAEAAFHDAVQLAPDNAGYLIGLGRVCRLAGHLDKALQYLNDAEEFDPANPALHFEIGRVREERQQFHEALQHYREAIRLDPADVESHFRAGMVCRAMKDDTEALRMFSRARELDPGHTEAFKQYGITYAMVVTTFRSPHDTSPLR